MVSLAITVTTYAVHKVVMHSPTSKPTCIIRNCIMWNWFNMDDRKFQFVCKPLPMWACQII